MWWWNKEKGVRKHINLFLNFCEIHGSASKRKKLAELNRWRLDARLVELEYQLREGLKEEVYEADRAACDIRVDESDL